MDEWKYFIKGEIQHCIVMRLNVNGTWTDGVCGSATDRKNWAIQQSKLL